MEDFRTLCCKRRSIRQFTDTPIEKDKLNYILDCALLAPSGKRLNPWEFIVVTDRDIIKELAGARTYGSQMMQTAMAAIVIALDASLTDTWQADGAIAAEHILLAAEEQGLGGCWCHIYGREDTNSTAGGAEALVKRLCKVDEKLTVLCVIALGYKAEERKTRELDKLPREKVLFR